MDNPVVSTPAAAISYDLTELKAHLRVTGTDDDTLLGRLAVLATQRLQQYLGRAFVNESYTWYLDGFAVNPRGPASDYWYLPAPSGSPRGTVIQLPIVPVASVTSIKYYDAAESLQTWNSANYRVDTVNGRISPSTTGSTYPQTADITNAVEILYVAGYGAADTDVPPRLKQAIYTLTGHYYENRESTLAFELTDAQLNGLIDLHDFKRWRF